MGPFGGLPIKFRYQMPIHIGQGKAGNKLEIQMDIKDFLSSLQVSANKATGAVRMQVQSVVDGANLMHACGSSDDDVQRFVNARIDQIRGKA